MNAPRALLALVALSTLLGLGWICGFAGPDDPGNSPDPEPEAIVVPFQMLPSNHMVVEARLNNKGPYRFIFDLGAPVTLLNNKAAEESGAIDKKAPRSFMMGARGEASVETLQLGNLKASKVPVIVMDHPALKALGGIFGRPLVGIVGYTFWARYRMTIDYQKKQLTFTPVDFEVTDLMKDLPSRMTGPKRSESIILAPRGLWGFTLAPPEEGLSNPGVPIAAVIPASPAEAAGLRPGDVLTSLDGRWTTSINDVHQAAQHVPPGRKATLAILRDGQELLIELAPAEGL